MKKIVKILIPLFFIVTVFAGCGKKEENLSTIEKVKQTKKLVVGIEEGYPPMEFRDENKNLVGFLTLRNVMEAISNLAPKAGGWLGIFTYSRPGYFYWEGVQSLQNIPVKKVIQPLVDVRVLENDNPAVAAEIILNRRITIVPVINDRNELVGIIRSVDLLAFFNQLFENAPG